MPTIALDKAVAPPAGVPPAAEPAPAAQPAAGACGPCCDAEQGEATMATLPAEGEVTFMSK